MYKKYSIALGMLCINPVIAQENNLDTMDLEDLLKVSVVSASRFEQSNMDAPASVTVITKEELANRQYNNIAEALNTVPGVYTSTDHDYTYTGVRGFSSPGDYGTRILLLADGARRNDPLYDQALFGNESPIDIDWVKQLEFVGGASSASYGPNALLGTVNAITFDGSDLQGSKLKLSTGANNKISILTGNKNNNIDWFLGVTAAKTKGENFYFPEYAHTTSNGHTNGLDGDQYKKIYAKLKIDNLQIIGNYSTRTKDVVTAPYGTAFNHPGTDTNDISSLIDVRYESDDYNGWQTKSRLYQGNYNYTGNWWYLNEPSKRDYAKAVWTGLETHLSYSSPEHKILTGVDLQWNTTLQQIYYEPSSGIETLNTNNPSRTSSIFIQDEWTISKNWIFNGAIRQDSITDYSTQLSPRAALIWKPTNKLSLKAIAGKAYRAPNSYERFYTDEGLTQLSNPALKPEHIKSLEFSTDYNLNNNSMIGLRIYQNKITNLIEQVEIAPGLSQFKNEEQLVTKGIELISENKWSNDLRVRGSVSYQTGHKNKDTSLVDSPLLMGKLIASVPLIEGWTASGEILGMSARKGDNGNVPGYGIANISMFSRMNPTYGQMRITVNNIGNKTYYDPTSSFVIQKRMPQDQTNVTVSWSLNF